MIRTASLIAVTSALLGACASSPASMQAEKPLRSRAARTFACARSDTATVSLIRTNFAAFTDNAMRAHL